MFKKTWRASLATVIATAVLSAPALAGPKLNMLINQSPWFDGFRKTLEMYEAETGASIELDVTPYPAMSRRNCLSRYCRSMI